MPYLLVFVSYVLGLYVYAATSATVNASGMNKQTNGCLVFL